MVLSICSANIRFENPADGQNDWPHRRSFLCEILNSRGLDLLGTQEGREPQLRDLENRLTDLILCDQNRQWIEERMYPCIYFNPKTIDVQDCGDIWLSKTPYTPGTKDFDSAFPRLSSWVRATHKESQKKFFYINCHLDHVKEETRIEQARVLCEEVGKHIKEGESLILTGDFNSSPLGPVRKVIEDHFSDIRDPWFDFKLTEESSFHKFDGKDPTGEATRIDWLLHSSHWKANQIELIKEQRNGQFPSDHFFVHSTLS